MYTLALAPEWLSPDYLISNFGLVGILVIVFAESGLFAFLPGDSLLFTAGLLVANGEYLHEPLWLVCTLIVAAAILGDQVGYLIGKFFGPKLFNAAELQAVQAGEPRRGARLHGQARPQGHSARPFRPDHPYVRAHGRGRHAMKYRTFLAFNVIGGTVWGAGVTLLGYNLGQFDLIKNNIETIFIGIVLISVIPVIFEVLKARKQKRPMRRRGSGRRGPPAGGRTPGLRPRPPRQALTGRPRTGPPHAPRRPGGKASGAPSRAQRGSEAAGALRRPAGGRARGSRDAHEQP